ncbi:DUF61 family protein [Methanosalsum zhilinae]|nr:DUF61 family protein [Methanosalsum zhilinae]
MRWMRVELGKLNRGVVANRKTLSQLLLEERPSSVTKSGDEYLFNEQIIEMLAEKLPGEIHDNLKFPIFFFNTIKVDESCYLNDKYALRALQILGELGESRSLHEGKVWVGKSIAYSIMKKYPSAIQIVVG